MNYVYILRNPSTDRYYIGSTTDLKRRLVQHKKGYTRTTRVLNMSELVYHEVFDTIENARRREKQLKSYKSRKYLNWLINQGPVAQPR